MLSESWEKKGPYSAKDPAPTLQCIDLCSEDPVSPALPGWEANVERH